MYGRPRFARQLARSLFAPIWEKREASEDARGRRGRTLLNIILDCIAARPPIPTRTFCQTLKNCTANLRLRQQLKIFIGWGLRERALLVFRRLESDEN